MRAAGIVVVHTPLDNVLSHALDTSAFGVARLKARFGESLRPYDLVWPYVATHENEAIQPSYILCNLARRSEVRTPRALVYIDLSQAARLEAIQSDLQGPRQAIVDYCKSEAISKP